MKLLSSLTFPIRWVDMDAYGHVSNAKYFDYMSETRATWFAQQKLLGHFNYVVIATSCQFKKELSYPKTITMEQYVARTTAASFTFEYHFKDAHTPDILYAQGEATLVCLSPGHKRPEKLPEPLQIALIK